MSGIEFISGLGEKSVADIKIYNANQIGGNYTVISTGKSKIMIDYGQTLPGSSDEQEEFDWENDSVDAVFLRIIMETM